MLSFAIAAPVLGLLVQHAGAPAHLAARHAVSPVMAITPTETAPIAGVNTMSVVTEGPTSSAELAKGKIYKGKELPPVLGAIRVGTRRLVVITGASSGLGLWAAKALADKGDYFVICAVRNPAKMDKVAKEIGLSKNDYIAMQLELASLQSVKDFVANLKLFAPAVGATPAPARRCGGRCRPVGPT